MDAQIQTLLKKVEEGQSSTAVSLRTEPYGTDAFFDYSWNPASVDSEYDSIVYDASAMLRSLYTVDDRCRDDFADFRHQQYQVGYDLITTLIYFRQQQLSSMSTFRTGVINDSISQLVGPRGLLHNLNREKRWMCSNLITSLKDHEYKGSPIISIQDLANASENSREDYWLEYWAELQC